MSYCMTFDLYLHLMNELPFLEIIPLFICKAIDISSLNLFKLLFNIIFNSIHLKE